MMSEAVNVLLTGELLQQQSTEASVAMLSQLFQVSEQQAAKMLAKTPLAIKKNVDFATAERFVTVLHRAGFGALIESIAPPTLEEPVSSSQSAPVSTPSLNEQQRLAESLDFQLVIPGSTPVAPPPVVPAAVVVPPPVMAAPVETAQTPSDSSFDDDALVFADDAPEAIDYTLGLMPDAANSQITASHLSSKRASFVVDDPLAPWENSPP